MLFMLICTLSCHMCIVFYVLNKKQSNVDRLVGPTSTSSGSLAGLNLVNKLINGSIYFPHIFPTSVFF